jgi:tetratricopeptide (TPR) repeat protein
LIKHASPVDKYRRACYVFYAHIDLSTKYCAEKETSMKKKVFFRSIAGLFLTLFLLFPVIVMAEESSPKAVDKSLCSKMIRHGQEAYQRGKYLDAKEYFRKAVQADPTSMAAWTYYDQAVIFALAEKVEKNAKLVMPDASTRSEQQAATPATAAPPPPKPKKKPAFVIMEDEGC